MILKSSQEAVFCCIKYFKQASSEGEEQLIPIWRTFGGQQRWNVTTFGYYSTVVTVHMQSYVCVKERNTCICSSCLGWSTGPGNQCLVFAVVFYVPSEWGGHKQAFVAERWLASLQTSPCSCPPLLVVSLCAFLSMWLHVFWWVMCVCHALQVCICAMVYICIMHICMCEIRSSQ